MPVQRRQILAALSFILHRLWQKAHWLLFGIAAAVLLSSVGQVAVPYLVSRLIDGLPDVGLQTAVFWGFIGYAVLLGLTRSLSQVVNFLSYIAGENINFIAATAFFERLIKKTSNFFIEHNPVEVQTARDQGQQAIMVVLQLAFIVFIPGLVQITLSLILMGVVINSTLVLIVLVYGCGFVAATYCINKWTRRYLDSAIHAGQENARFVGSAISAMETLRYFRGDQWANETFGLKAREVLNAWGGWATRRLAAVFLFGLALGTQLALSFSIFVPRYYAGELSVGDIVLIHTLLLQLNQPFEMFGSAIDDVVRSWSRFLPFARMWNASEEHDVQSETPFRLSSGSVVFRNLTFLYSGKRILENVNFSANRGALNFVVGMTGAGKSTLFKIALKTLQPSEGAILVDGVDLAGISRRQWFNLVGVVPQEILMLNDTIAVNIALGRKLDRNRLEEAARKASILHFVTGHPDGFETNVGERGLKISGGERQRLAIARALYDDPQILFLDEASSALDDATEQSIMSELRQLAGEVTIVAITHRKSVIEPGDNVFELVARTVETASI